MRFRVTNISKGYCEVFANRYDGGRYERIAYVTRLDNGWLWTALDYLILPEENFVAQSTRKDCIVDCERTALVRQMERAIEMQPKRSDDWHSPRRTAFRDMDASNLFTLEEMDYWALKSRTFEEATT